MLARLTKLINHIGKDLEASICSTRRQDLGGPDFGGARRDRTDDLMLAKHALSQLSYGPVSRPAGAQVVVGLGGLEPPTSRLSSARSNQLSYKPGRKKKPGARSGFQNQRRRKSSISLSERETKAARSRKMRPDWPLDSEPDDKPLDEGEPKSLGETQVFG